jgi:hypothetical protein
MAQAPNTLAARRPLWQALSDLYLDNEPTERDLAWIADVCARSPYSLNEINHIMFGEVYPSLIGNLFSMAGEWAGFDPEWLINKISQNQSRRTFLPWWINPVKQYYLGAYWRCIRRKIHEKRLSI